jgi:hypothetical protein
MGQLLGKEQLLKGDELKKEKLEFNDGNYVYVREMTAHEKNTWEHSLYKTVKGPKGQQDMQMDLSDYNSKLAVCTLCGEDGKLLFSFNEYKKLGDSMSAAKMDKIVEVSQRINGITDEEKENLLNSSEADQNEDSNFDSAKN